MQHNQTSTPAEQASIVAVTSSRDPRLLQAPHELADADLVAVLEHVYRDEPVPPCRVCGGPLSIQKVGGGYAVEWGCSPYEDDPASPDLVSKKPGRGVADDHFAQSKWTQHRIGDPRVLELVRRFRKATQP